MGARQGGAGRPRLRYLAADFGSRGIRVNAISAGFPFGTLAGFWHGDAPRRDVPFQAEAFAARGGVTLSTNLAARTLYLLSDIMAAALPARIPLRRFRLHIVQIAGGEDLKNGRSRFSASSLKVLAILRRASKDGLARLLRAILRDAREARRAPQDGRCALPPVSRALERRGAAQRRCSGRKEGRAGTNLETARTAKFRLEPMADVRGPRSSRRESTAPFESAASSTARTALARRPSPQATGFISILVGDLHHGGFDASRARRNSQ